MMTNLTRRSLVATAGAAVLAGALPGCVDTSDAPTSGSGPSAQPFSIPDWPNHPTDPRNVRWIDSGDGKTPFFNDFFSAYEEKFDNVTIDYKPTNVNAIREQVTLGLRNGTAPDVFTLPASISTPVAHREGWLHAFDDVIPDWDRIKDAMPAGMIVDGVNQFDGKTYRIPVSRPWLESLLLINTEIAERSDIDVTQPFSLDTLGEAVRKVTKAGGGDYFGMIDFLGQANGMVMAMGRIAQLSGLDGGAAANNIAGSVNWKTREFVYDDPILAEVIEWYLGMEKDGCFVPGSVTFDAPGARERFPQGVAGFFFQGPWNINLWEQQYPNFSFDVRLVPLMDPGQADGFITSGMGGVEYCMSATTDAADVVGNLMSYILSEEGQAQWTTYVGTEAPAIVPPAEIAHPLHRRVTEYMDQFHRLGPSPSVRNPDVEKATRILNQPKPNLHGVCVSLFTRETTDVRKELKALQDRANRALDKAIAEARSEGADVSREDWVFADWEPGVPYEKLYQK